MGAFKVDFSELEKFKDELKITQQDFENFLRNFLIEMVNRVIAKTKPRTPKDTGALQGGWNISEVSGSGKEVYAIINNPMEYATEIEYGHRIVAGGIEVGWYEGRFMLKTSIDEIDAQMPARYEKAFRLFCKQRGLDAD